MPGRKIDELFYDVTFAVDESGVKRAQKRARELNKVVTQGQDDLEQFGEAGTSALRKLGEAFQEAGQQSVQIEDLVDADPKALIEALSREFARELSGARFRFAEGLINEDEFRQAANQAVDSFNTELQKLEEFDLITTAQRERFVEELRSTASESVDAMVDELSTVDEEAEAAVRETGDRLADAGGIAARGFTDRLSEVVAQGETSVRGAVSALVRDLEDELIRRLAELDVEFQQGLISEDEFERQTKRAVEAFNRELGEIEAGFEREMDLPREVRLQMIDAFEDTGRDSVDALVEEVREGSPRVKRALGEVADEADEAGAGMTAAFRSARLAFAAVTGVIATSKLAGFLRESARSGIELAQSLLKLRASAKLFGVEQAELNALAERGKEEFRLTISEANELSVVLTKLAARAGDVSKAEEALAAALDLGAAQGLDAREVAVSLDQALRGLNEGTDKLLQKDPSQIFDDYASSIGKSAAKLTDAEEKQALLNAIIEAGSRVTGEYNRFLESNIGELSTWERMIQAAHEEIGTAMLPVLAELVDVLEGPLRTGVDVLVGLFEAIESLTTDPLERLVDRLREAGDETGRLAELQLQLQQIQLQNERIQLRRAQQRERVTARDVGDVEVPGQPVTEERQIGRREAGLTATATVAFDVSDVSTERLSRTLDDLIGAQGEIADRVNRTLAEGNQAAAENLALQEERARKLAEELGAVLERRQRQREVERELKENAGALVELRRKEFDLTPGDGAETPTPEKVGGLTEEQIEARRQAVAGLIDQLETLASVGLGALQMEELTTEQRELVGELQAVEDEIQTIEEAMEAGAGTDAMARRLEFLREQHVDLREEIAETIRGYDDLEEALGRIRDSVGLPEGIEELPRPEFDLEATQTEALRELAEFSLELERSSLSAEERLDALGDKMAELGISGEDLREGTSRLATEIRTRLLRILPEWAAEMLQIAQNTDGAGESTRDLLDDVRDLAQLAGGVLSLASAFGVFGDEAEAALQRGISSATQLVQGINSLQAAIEEGASGLALLGPAGAIAGGAAGLVSAIGGLFEDTGAERRAEARREAVRKNTAALEQLRTNIDELISAIGGLPGDIVEAARALGEIEVFVSGNLASGATKGSFQEQFLRQLEALGLNLTDLETIADATGISLQNLSAILRGDFSEGSIPAAISEFEALQEAITELEIDRLTESFTGALDVLRQEFEVFDIEDPIQQLRRMKELLLEFTDLPTEFESAIRGANLSTPEGRAQFERTLERLFTALTEGGIGFEALGELTVDQLRDILGTLESTLDEAMQEAGDAGADAQSFQIFRGVTETTAQRLEGLGSTRNLILHNIDRNVAAIADDMGVGSGPAGGFLEPGGFPPDGGDGGGGGIDAEMIPGGPILLPSQGLQPPPQPPTTQQILLDIAVDADIDLRGVDSPEEVAEIVAQLLGDRVTDDVNERLGRKLRGLLRGEHGIGMERRV